MALLGRPRPHHLSSKCILSTASVFVKGLPFRRGIPAGAEVSGRRGQYKGFRYHRILLEDLAISMAGLKLHHGGAFNYGSFF